MLHYLLYLFYIIKVHGLQLFKMNTFRKTASLFIFLFLCTFTEAQPKRYTPANAHAHNDYLNVRPFYQAYEAHFGSIEADVFPVNGVLLVAHKKEEVQPQHTLKAMYLEPLANALQKDSTRRLNLLIDVKENYKLALALLIQEVQPLKDYLSYQQNKNRLTILISGERPPPAEYKNYPPYIFFDDDLKLPHTPEEWSRVELVSLSFQNFSKWTGEGSLPKTDKRLLKQTVKKVHTSGKPIRFWAAPDTKISWLLQKKLHVDLIGTDKIEELAAFLNK